MILGNYLNNDWEKYLKNELEKEYFKKIEDFLNTQIKLEKTIYPKKEDIFSVFNKLKLKEIKVVII
jgi:uracil-DNA glycosylase